MAVTVALVLSGLAPVGAASPRSLDPAAVVEGLHVVHPTGGTPYLADASGRFVMLRGVDDNALVQYPTDYAEAPPLVRSDLAEMAALGFNFLRLPVSWSRIMPHPGTLDRAYLARVAQVVRWARASGIGVLVDMHQDNYATVDDHTQEADGAPGWAVVDHGVPCTKELTTTKCALASFHSFWSNVTVANKPLQTWYLEAAIAVAKAAGATHRAANVVGVELMNEPWPTGTSFEQDSLSPFYRRMIDGLRRAGVVSPLWFEPSILRDVTNDALGAATPFSADPNLVYAVHIYSGVFSQPSGPTASLPSMVVSYANAAKEAAAFHTPFVVDEYGSNATPAWNGWLQAQLHLQNAYTVGSGFWLWKQRVGRWYDWAVVHLNGSLRRGTARAQLLSQPHVDAVPGNLVATRARDDHLSATVEGPGGKALLWGGTVVTSGGATLTRRTLRHVTIDDHPVPAACHHVRFVTSTVGLAGCLLSVEVPAGRHTVVATP